MTLPSGRIVKGDAVEVLRTWPAKSVHMAVTSPPYLGQRDYLTASWQGGKKGCQHTSVASSCSKCGARRLDKQIGLESDPWEYVAKLVAVFHEMKRVLRDDGTLWINLSAVYSNRAGNYRGNTSTIGLAGSIAKLVHQGHRNAARKSGFQGFKMKDFVPLPEMLALALMEDGWHLRHIIIWKKPNGVPESVDDRPSRFSERILLLSKSSKYYYDNQAVREEARDWGTRDRSKGSHFVEGVMPTGQPHKGLVNGDFSERGRNLRDVWEFPTKGTGDEHYATFPIVLPERCILLGSSEYGCCAVCGTPWRRMKFHACAKCGEAIRLQYKRCSACGHVNDWKKGRDAIPELRSVDFSTPGIGAPRLPGNFKNHTQVGAWEPGCSCKAKEVVPAVVCDPFAGTGTTGAAAYQAGRSFVGIDLLGGDHVYGADGHTAQDRVDAARLTGRSVEDHVAAKRSFTKGLFFAGH